MVWKVDPVTGGVRPSPRRRLHQTTARPESLTAGGYVVVISTAQLKRCSHDQRVDQRDHSVLGITGHLFRRLSRRTAPTSTSTAWCVISGRLPTRPVDRRPRHGRRRWAGTPDGQGCLTSADPFGCQNTVSLFQVRPDWCRRSPSPTTHAITGGTTGPSQPLRRTPMAGFTATEARLPDRLPSRHRRRWQGTPGPARVAANVVSCDGSVVPPVNLLT